MEFLLLMEQMHQLTMVILHVRCLLAVCSVEGRVKLYRQPYCEFQAEWIEVCSQATYSLKGLEGQEVPKDENVV